MAKLSAPSILSTLKSVTRIRSTREAVQSSTLSTKRLTRFKREAVKSSNPRPRPAIVKISAGPRSTRPTPAATNVKSAIGRSALETGRKPAIVKNSAVPKSRSVGIGSMKVVKKVMEQVVVAKGRSMTAVLTTSVDRPKPKAVDTAAVLPSQEDGVKIGATRLRYDGMVLALLEEKTEGIKEVRRVLCDGVPEKIKVGGRILKQGEKGFYEAFIKQRIPKQKQKPVMMEGRFPSRLIIFIDGPACLFSSPLPALARPTNRVARPAQSSLRRKADPLVRKTVSFKPTPELVDVKLLSASELDYGSTLAYSCCKRKSTGDGRNGSFIQTIFGPRDGHNGRIRSCEGSRLYKQAIRDERKMIIRDKKPVAQTLNRKFIRRFKAVRRYVNRAAGEDYCREPCEELPYHAPLQYVYGNATYAIALNSPNVCVSDIYSRSTRMTVDRTKIPMPVDSCLRDRTFYRVDPIWVWGQLKLTSGISWKEAKINKKRKVKPGILERCFGLPQKFFGCDYWQDKNLDVNDDVVPIEASAFIMEEISFVGGLSGDEPWPSDLNAVADEDCENIASLIEDEDTFF